MDSVSKTKRDGSVLKSKMDGHVECGRTSTVYEVERLPYKTGVHRTVFEIVSRCPNGPANFISFLATLLF